jgi:outer membrane lipoprotein SlyB
MFDDEGQGFLTAPPSQVQAPAKGDGQKGLFQMGGGALGGIIGAYIGGPQGAIAGYKAGSTAGGAVADIGNNNDNEARKSAIALLGEGASLYAGSQKKEG